MPDEPSVELRPLRFLRVSRTLALDLVTSYGVSIARAGAMLAIVALLGHRTTTGYLAAFLFLRAMLGLLNNLFAGAQPAAMAAMRTQASVPPPAPTQAAYEAEETMLSGGTPILAYESKQTRMKPDPTKGWDGLFLASVGPAVLAYIIISFGMPLLTAAAAPLLPASRVGAIAAFSLPFTLGLLGRLASDPAGGVLQLRKLLWLDNLLVAAAEIWWVYASFAGAGNSWQMTFVNVGTAYLVSGVALFIARWAIAAILLVEPRRFSFAIRLDIAGRFLAVSGMLAFASLGDFLYAPANNLIINRLLDPLLIAAYGPALQVDALLLLAVSSLASVMLPRVVMLHEAGNFRVLRRAYLVSTIVGVVVLAIGAVGFVAFSDPLLRVWLGDVPPGTRAILPFVLVHTVLGGTAGIGRATLFGIGRFKAWTIASLGGGILNVCLALFFVAVFGWGLRGIVFATILIVTLRNAVWMPWYILKSLREDASRRTE